MAFPDSFVNITANTDFSASGMSATKLNKDWADMYRTGLRDIGYELSGVISGGIQAASAAHAISAVVATSGIHVVSANSADLVDGSHASAFALAGHGHSHTALTDIGTNTHAQVDTFIASKAAASGLASLDAASLVVQNPASASATPGASNVVMSGADASVGSWWHGTNNLTTLGPRGKSVVLHNPYAPTKADSFKGALHTHTTGSDGADTPTALVTAYKNAGYDFVSITDHDVFTADPAVADIVFVPGVEETASGSYPGHITATNATQTWAESSAQGIIDYIELDGAIPGMAHPDHAINWTDEGLAALFDYKLIEVYNDVADEGGGEAEAKWDEILKRGVRVWGTAVDDCHNVATTHFDDGWVVVNADTCTAANIEEALRSGNFYSQSRGSTEDAPPTFALTTSGHTITATTNASSTIVFKGKGGTLQTSTTVTTASYTPVGTEVFVRVLVTRDSDGLRTWSQPVFVDRIGEPRSAGGVYKQPFSVSQDSSTVSALILRQTGSALAASVYGATTQTHALTANHGYYLNQSGILAATYRGMYVYSGTAQTTGTALFEAKLDEPTSTIPCGIFRQHGSGDIIQGIDTNDSTVYALGATGVITSTLNTAGYGWTLNQAGNGGGCFINNDGTGFGHYISQDGVLASNKFALSVYSDAAQITPTGLIRFKLDNVNSTIPVLHIVNDGSGNGLYFQQTQGSGAAMTVYADSNQSTGTCRAGLFYGNSGTITGGDWIAFEANDAGITENGGTKYAMKIVGKSWFARTLTITGAVTDGYAASLLLDPGYTAATAQTVTRHNYIDVQNVSVAGAGPAAVTDACLVRFDAAAGTHKALAAAAGVGTAGWIKVNNNGTLGYVPIRTAATAAAAFTAVSDPPTQAEVTAIRDAIIAYGIMAAV